MVCPNYDWIRIDFEKMGGYIFSALGACMKRLIGYTAALCLLAITVGCGGVTSTGTLAYISNSNGTGFTVFTVNTDGTLTMSNISPQSTPTRRRTEGDPVFPNGKWAYFLDNARRRISTPTPAQAMAHLSTYIVIVPGTPRGQFAGDLSQQHVSLRCASEHTLKQASCCFFYRPLYRHSFAGEQLHERWLFDEPTDRWRPAALRFTAWLRNSSR